MNVDLILSTFNQHRADYILIGGMNFFLNHQPVFTLDVDLWASDTAPNLTAIHRALRELDVEVSFDSKGADWRLVQSFDSAAWLSRRAVHCLTSPHGSIDVFFQVKGLEAGYGALRPECEYKSTPSGVSYRSLSDALMIRCQLALEPRLRKLDRLRTLGYIGDS